ncbi:MAG: phage tail protein [Bacteroidetes bacterium]|jgi:microcystin-dependent protein|nr:phage tail protein [Bacteroidota bacterium]
MFIEPYLANITIFAGNFAPRSWMFCQGQLLAIAQYDALFALIGTTYGGDGQTTFALPDMRGRIANNQGQGPGLSNYVLGQMSGTENVSLTSAQMPIHNHSQLTFTGNPPALNAAGTTDNPNNAFPAAATGSSNYASSDSGDALQPSSCVSITTVAGGSQPVNIISPYLAMNYIIAVEGIFPSRN